MKKLSFCFFLAISVLTNINAQETVFGASAGYNSLIVSVKFDGVSASSSVSGFYLGVFADIKTSEKFYIQPELQYAVSIQDSESGNMLVLPIMGKFYVSNEFSLQFGPQFDLILDDSEGVKAFGIGLAAGIAYDISEKFFASFRYSLGLTNRLDTDSLVFEEEINDPSFNSFDIKTKFNFLQAGIGYKF